MEKRFFLFILLASAAMFINVLLMNWLNPPPPPKPKPQQPVAKQPAEGPEEKQEGQADEAPAVAAPEPPAVAEAPAAEPQADVPPQWVALGSVDPDDPYRMLAIVTNRGAAVEQIELNSPQLRELDEESGYLAQLALQDAPGRGGAVVNVVGKGTPAAKANLQAGDVITEFNGAPVKDSFDLRAALRTTKPDQQVTLKIRRGDEEEKTLTATLTRAPLELVQSEDSNSLLFTLQQLGNREISRDLGLQTREPERGYGAQISQITPDSPAAEALLRVGDVITQVDERDVESPADLTEIIRTTPVGTPLAMKVLRDGQELQIGLRMPAEIAGFTLRTGNWEVVSKDDSQATFRYRIPAEGLEFIKRYRLAKADDQAGGRDYHLLVDVEIRNTGSEARKLAYQLDGPTGLPTEGWWYASKISRDWGAVGVRDVAVWFRGEDPELIPPTDLIGEEAQRMPVKNPLIYAGVDAQYVAAVLLPQHKASDELWFSEVIPLRVGPIPSDKNRWRLLNTSIRLVSASQELQPGGPPLKHEYVFFAGPKRPDLLAKYQLGELVYYGWFGWVAQPMLTILHFFYDLVGNYGLAIIMLTVLVRGCMFPLSRKQAISAQKMQELQPELKKLAEKYKSNLEQRNKAQQELFKKHNYNPLGGCLLMFIQLPIFIGLYRSLMVDVELWQAPLVSGLQWCSNLAAPDMLFRWKEYLPAFLADETGWLGPYFNILPIFTIALFLWQQKMFMPPPTDEQAAMQQKMIKYMMIFMGVMFFKVASGLCIYFIASSLWGIAERKLLPKTLTTKPPTTEQPATPRVAPAAGTNGNGATTGRQRKKQRGRK